MRAFIAVELDRPAMADVSGLVRRLAGKIAGVRWIKPGNIHVTIKFLGEISPETRALVERVLGDVASGVAPFGVTLGELGAFPGLRRPRVLWIGIEKGREEMRRLYARVEEELAAVGIPREGRAYTPHVTIGRRRRAAESERLEGFARDRGLGSSFVVDRVALIESTLGPKGAVHRTIFEAPMKGANMRPRTTEKIETTLEAE